jgi:hypothetical protein
MNTQYNFVIYLYIVIISYILDIQGVIEMRGQILTTSWLHVELGKNI